MKLKSFLLCVIFLMKLINNKSLKNEFLLTCLLKINSYSQKNIKETYNQFLDWSYNFFIELKKQDDYNSNNEIQDININIIQKLIELNIMNKVFYDFLMDLIMKDNKKLFNIISYFKEIKVSIEFENL